jgi:glycosyltransferase involved in cell wall biosynthesis
MRVALVASSLPPRPEGPERHVSKLARALARRGVQVEVLTQVPGREPTDVLIPEGVIVRHFRVPVGAAHGAIAPGLWEALRRSNGSFDVAHVHSPHPSFAAAAMGVGPRGKVFTPHAPVKLLVRWPYLRVTRAAVRHAALTLCTSITESELLAERIPFAADRIAGLTGGVDAEAIAAARPFSGPARSTVLARGPLERRRRVDRAIGAMASLADSYRLVIAGAGPAAGRLAAHAADLRVASRMTFLGPVADSELYRWLRTARVVVALADQASSGIEVTEALAAAIPVVASDIPVHREAAGAVAGAGVTLVSPEGSPLEVADAISVAVLAREVAPPAAIATSWDAVADATLSAYERSLDGRRGAARARVLPVPPELAK